MSPANKDRPAHREAFVSKCVTYLQQGVGLVIVDVVTGRRANLHNDFLVCITALGTSGLNADLYAVAYRLVSRNEQPSLDIWQETLSVGQSLPILPLWLRGSLCLPVDLETTYNQTCREQLIKGI